jgi:FtsP/CotA-like multicopper oxidase with cupredoxin domain
MNRRQFLELMGGAACWDAASRLAAQQSPPLSPADFTLRISPVELETAPGRIIKTTGYNGSSPGPVLRLQEGKPVTIEVQNETSDQEFVHWHGLFVPSDVDGVGDEGTPAILAHGKQRYSFVPRPSGTRWYHTHVSAGRDLKRSTYSGQFGVLYIEPKNEPGDYDAEIFLTLHGWDPYLSTMGDDEGFLEVGYKSYSINSHALGSGEPIRVQKGQKVIFRIVNSSATLPHRLALSGHSFTVLNLDGNPVPVSRTVDVLELGPAERVDAVVTMNRPGVWILGELDDKIRDAGLGTTVEYANQKGPAQWLAPAITPWDYTIFGRAASAPAPDVEVIPLVFRSKFAGNRWVQHWTINGKSYPKTDPILVKANQKYRLRFDNQSDEAHPVHLHRHSFELTKVAGKPTAGILKDVVMVPARNQVEVDLLADNPGPSLFHCHMQLHMDFGFMAMLRYKD